MELLENAFLDIGIELLTNLTPPKINKTSIKKHPYKNLAPRGQHLSLPASRLITTAMVLKFVHMVKVPVPRLGLHPSKISSCFFSTQVVSFLSLFSGDTVNYKTFKFTTTTF